MDEWSDKRQCCKRRWIGQSGRGKERKLLGGWRRGSLRDEKKNFYVHNVYEFSYSSFENPFAPSNITTCIYNLTLYSVLCCCAARISLNAVSYLFRFAWLAFTILLLHFSLKFHLGIYLLLRLFTLKQGRAEATEH